jgi:hypothetical protein
MGAEGVLEIRGGRPEKDGRFGGAEKKITWMVGPMSWEGE